VDKRKTAIARLLELLRANPSDVRSRLKLADLYAKDRDYLDAIEAYEWVAKHYAEQGFVLKAIAVYTQIRRMLVEHAPHLQHRYAHIGPTLTTLLERLGLKDHDAN
jgi:lipopolysaccharide biosynthesis regulator YciM